MQAIQSAGYEPGRDVAIALDVAASELFQDGEYVFKKGDGSRRLGGGHGLTLYASWSGIRLSPSRTDWRRATGQGGLCSPNDCTIVCSWLAMISSPQTCRLAGNRGRRRQRRAGEGEPDRDPHRNAANHRLARGGACGVVSPRSGETEDHDRPLAVATSAGQIKTGGAKVGPIGPPSLTSSSESRKSWAISRITRGLDLYAARHVRALGRAGGAGVRAVLRGAGRGIRHARSAPSPERGERRADQGASCFGPWWIP